MQRKRIGLNAGYSSLCAPASCYSLTRGGRSTSTGKRPIASMSSRGDAGLTRRVAAVSAPETGASVQPGWSSVIEVARDPGINPGINRGNAGGSAGHAPYENCAAHAPRFPGSLGSSPNRHCVESRRSVSRALSCIRPLLQVTSSPRNGASGKAHGWRELIARDKSIDGRTPQSGDANNRSNA